MANFPHEIGKRGVIAAGDRQTAAAGARIFREGGNAADAIVAAGMAAFVCEVALCGPLGGGVAVSQFGGDTPLAWDFFARVPGLGAKTKKPQDFGQAVIDFGVTQQAFRVGKGAAALGLALPGLIELHASHGRLPLNIVVEPAVELGRKGFLVGEQMAYILSLIEPIFRWTPETHGLCFPNGNCPEAGARLFNRALADVLESVGRDTSLVNALYTQLADEYGPSAGGLVTQRDIDGLRIDCHKAIEFDWHNWRIASMPAPSSGGVLIGTGARLIKDIGARVGAGSTEHMLEMANVQRLLLGVRSSSFDERICSSEFVDGLLRAWDVDVLRKMGENVDFADNFLGSTTHMSAMDAELGTVSLTLTNGEGCGSNLSGTGIQVNNLLGEEDINPKGFHQADPGTRMNTMMAPTIARSQTHRLALGSGGSNRLRNAILSTLLNVIEFETSLETAVEMPRLHVDRSGDQIVAHIEDVGDVKVLCESLRKRYDDVTIFPGRNMFFGGVHAVEWSADGPSGTGDLRRGGAVAFG